MLSDGCDAAILKPVSRGDNAQRAVSNAILHVRDAVPQVLGGDRRMGLFDDSAVGVLKLLGFDDTRCDLFHEHAGEVGGHLPFLEGGGGSTDRSAAFVAEHDDQGHPEILHREFQGSGHGGVHAPSGGADDEEFAEAGVEKHLDRHPRIGTRQHCCVRFLAGAQFLEAGAVVVWTLRSFSGETLISFEQVLPGLSRYFSECHGHYYGTVIDPAKVTEWFRANARDLPWREPSTSPWGVLLSEVMSQQTPVARVAPQWREWMRRWPAPADLAAAPTSEVLRAWGTLGYPRRALRLQECAAALVDVHNGQVPSAVDKLLALPGIGDYTARAVACFAFGQAVPVVDTNVRRVYARAELGRPVAKPQKAELEWVAELLPGTDADVFSAGLMELGALVCTATNPACKSCPLISDCAWVAAGSPAPTEEELAGKKVQKFVGTDRQVRGKIMKVLREANTPVEQGVIDLVWPDAPQRSRALFSLLEDGLAVQDANGRFRLP